MVDEMTNSRPIIKPAQQKPILITNSPAFETLVLGKSTGTIGSQTLRGNSERWEGSIMVPVEEKRLGLIFDYN